ncbi:hypothetical protein [Kineosporia babensis]|uniref:Uncharacterized protein n=1 Tax=Kineosporia babensis TaxID=499548 RepID=A0A9X1NE23_9ACTN|nr:hypothetical protein [Kineosporia babensis]MCD5312119.1 hypothetical protein [Kineosporia babensis]
MGALAVGGELQALSRGDVPAVVASLPVSLRLAEPSDLVALEGGPGWPERVAAATARGVMVVHPTPAAPEAVPAHPGAPVVLNYRFADNPVMPTAARLFTDWPADAMIEAAAVVAQPAELDGVLLDQLATLRRLGSPAVELTRLTWSSAGYYLSAVTRTGVRLLLSAHVTTATSPQLRIRGLAPSVALELTLPDPGTAQPAVLVRTTDAGATKFPTLWESSHRAGWRRLVAAVDGTTPADDLTGLRTDLGLLAPLLPAS